MSLSALKIEEVFDEARTRRRQQRVLYEETEEIRKSRHAAQSKSAMTEPLLTRDSSHAEHFRS